MLHPLRYIVQAVIQINAARVKKEAAEKLLGNTFHIKIKEKGEFNHIVTVTSEEDSDETKNHLEAAGHTVKTDVHPY